MNAAPTRSVTVDRLRWAFALLVASLTGVLIVTGAITARHRGPDGGVPDWFGLVVVLVAGGALGLVVRYWRRRPILPGRYRDYAATISLRMATAALPALIGLGMYLATGTWWVQLAGFALSVAWLTWAVPSEADYERHQRLAVGPPPMPPDDAWGAAQPDEVAPWEDEHGGHGHGLVDF